MHFHTLFLESFLTWRTKWPGCGSGCVCTPFTCVAGGHSETSLVQLWGSPRHLDHQERRPSLAPRSSGNVPSTAPIPMVCGPWSNHCHALPVNHSPNFLFPRALCVYDVRPGYIKPIAERTRADGSHGHIATMVQKEWKIQRTSGTVIHLTYPE